jgi:hypothetical protein
MSAQLPRPSASAGAASGRAVIRSKIGIATQWQREQAMLLAQVDKSREPAIDKTRALNRLAPATPSSIEGAHCLLQHSVMKQINVPLRARTMSPVFELPATIPELPPTLERAAAANAALPLRFPTCCCCQRSRASAKLPPPPTSWLPLPPPHCHPRATVAYATTALPTPPTPRSWQAAALTAKLAVAPALPPRFRHRRYHRRLRFHCHRRRCHHRRFRRR